MLNSREEIKKDLLHIQTAVIGMKSVMNVLERDVRETDTVIDNLSLVNSSLALLLQNYENKKMQLLTELIRTAPDHEHAIKEVQEIEEEIAVQALMAYAVDDEEEEQYDGYN